jgi:hypothetical protein
LSEKERAGYEAYTVGFMAIVLSEVRGHHVLWRHPLTLEFSMLEIGQSSILFRWQVVEQNAQVIWES